MILKVFKKAFKLLTAPLRKILGWLFKVPDPQDPAAVLVEKQGSDHPIPVIYGTRKIGVIKVHKYVTDLSGGADNELLHLICVLCEGEIDAIEEVFFDGKSENDPQWRKDKNNPASPKWFTVHRYLGAADQAVSFPAVSAIPNWGFDHKLSGLAYLYVVLQMDKDQSIWRGEPEITARVRGRKIYDPRSNTTAYSENPAIQLLDYLQNTVYGKGLSSGRLVLPSIIAAANVADETVNSTVIQNGTPTTYSHKRFSSNTYVDTGTSVFNNVQQMLSSMRGSLPIGSGSLRLQIETEASPVFYFSHGRSEQLNHATITGKIKSSGGGKKDRFNRVVVRFPNAALDFERDEVFYPDSEDPLFAEWLAEDNGVLLEQNFEFNTITNKAEALQMARIIALRSRFQLQCGFTASPAAIVVEPGDVVGITDDTRGWDAKPFRVEQVKLKDDGDVELEFIEHQNAIYPWSGTTYEERIGGTNLGDPTNIPAPTGLSIAPDLTLATGGRLTWSMANNAFVRRFRVKISNAEGEFFSEETIVRAMVLPLLDAGEYTISVFALSTLNTLSPPAVIAFNLVQPQPPTEIQFTRGNFEIEARPVLAGAGLGTQFEFAIGDTTTVRGRGISLIFTGLAHSTEYTIFARTVNALGTSAWISRTTTTTANGANIVDLIGEDVGASIFDDVVTAVNTELQQTVEAALVDVPTDVEVQQLIDDSIATVNAADTEDPRVQVLYDVMSVIGEQENRAEIKRTDFLIAQEGQVRAAAILELNAADASLLTQIQQVTTDLQGNSDALVALQGVVTNPVTGLSASFSLAQQAKTTADGNTSSISQIQNEVENLDLGLTGTVSFVQQVEILANEAQDSADNAQSTANSAVSSVNSLTATVNNATTGLSATNQLAQQAKTTADGAASSVNSLTATVNNATTGLSATNQLAQQAKSTADGAVSSLTTLQSTVSGINDELGSAQLSLQATINELGDVSARAFFGVTNVSGGVARVNGVVVDGATNTLEFRADTMRLTNTAGVVQMYYDTGTGRWVYNGDLIAANFKTANSGYRAEMGTGTYPFWYGTGTKNLTNALFAVDTSGNVNMRNAQINGGTIRMIGATAMSIESQTPFGPHNLLEWKGKKINGVNWDTSTNQPILSGLLKGNASYYYSADDQVYFSGSILAGTLRNAQQSTQLGANTEVETGSYGSNGGTITIKCSFGASKGQSGSGTCPVSSNPTGTMYLDRWNGSSWQQVASHVMTGQYNCLQEGGEYLSSWTLTGSFTFTDNLLSTANRRYRLRVTHTTPVLPNGTQNLSIISEE
ncbi:phage tail protein [Arsukibacterium sp.]|uniref:phage tail tip protein J-related protein n=1 Tax=Arsukibacterium sp. TaxID=1977258 RepID=UPI00299F2BE5|nr:phage tail protein [Arsukibacterium sp.]MDX1538820.1 phage tail protein [Arsukibacterium sp.]